MSSMADADLERAVDLARFDQGEQGARQTAGLIVAFRQELLDGGLHPYQVDDLVHEFALRLLDVPDGDDVEPEGGD